MNDGAFCEAPKTMFGYGKQEKSDGWEGVTTGHIQPNVFHYNSTRTP